MGLGPIFLFSWQLWVTAVPRQVTLDYERETGTEACSDATEFQQAVEKRLGLNPFVDVAPEKLSVRLVRSSQGYEAFMKLLDAHGHTSGERQLTSRAKECQMLMSAVELAVAVLLDPQYLLRQNLTTAEPSDEVETSSDTSQEPEPISKSESMSTVSPDASIQQTVVAWGLHAGVGASQHYGLAPNVAVAGSALVGLHTSSFSLELSGHFSVPQSVAVAPGAVRLTSNYAQISPCARFGSWGLCGVSKVGAFRIQGQNLFSGTKASPLLWTMGVRGTYDIPVSSLMALRLDVAMEALVARTDVTVDARPLFSPSWAVASGGICLIFKMF